MKNLFILILLVSCAHHKPGTYQINNAESCTFHQGHFYFSNFEAGRGFINIITKTHIKELPSKGLKTPFGIRGYKDYLLINDGTKVHIYNLKEREIVNTIEIPGAKFLNDIAVDERGNFFTADSKNQKIYTGHVSSSVVSEYFRVDFVPNGLLVDGDKLLITSWGQEMNDSWDTKKNGRLWSFSFTSQELTLFSDKRIGHLDGIEKLDKEKYLVSAKRENALYIFEKGKTPKLHIEALGPADIGLSDDMVCIPSFTDKRIELIQY